MPRYGSGAEDFRDQAKRLEELRRARAALAAAEAQQAEASAALGETEVKTTRASNAGTRARKEKLEVDQRGAAVSKESVTATDADTAAIERNTAARKRGTASTSAQQVAAKNAQAAQIGRGLILHPTAATGVRTSVEAVGQTGSEAIRAAAAAPVGSVARAANSERGVLSTLTRQRRDYINGLHEEANVKLGQLPQASAAVASGLQREATSFGTVSQAMHKHGALTSEFILASARGETTLKELGNQAIITAGKFGGWTAAATALFGAAAAIGKVGHGAIDASSGVNQLQRVINGVKPDQALAAFADLSRHFNVPIDVAADAVYRMGQRFHTLPEAVAAARSSLYSFKTGEVDVASSSKNLLSIVSAFGLTAGDLGGVYDQINQAQNTFGIGIQDTEEGLAKAGGAYRNAGGDLNYLLGLFVAIGRQTGQSGNIIGTAIARAVSQIRIPRHQDTLRALGIDVDPENLQKTIQSAIKRARDGALTHAQQNEAASAIFGNQYARLLSPLLRDASKGDKSVLSQGLTGTSPGASKDSAEKELQTTLHSVREEISALGNGLQRLGVQLVRAGALDFAGGLLKGLNAALLATEDLIRVYDEIPKPLRESLTLLIEMALAIKTLQRLGGLEGFAGGVLGSSDQRLKTRAVKGARDFRDNALDESERSGARSAAAANAAARADLAAQRAAADVGAKRATLASAPSEENLVARSASEERYLAATAQSERLNAKSVILAEEANDARALANEAEAAYARTQAVHATQVRRFVTEQRTAIPVETAVPSTKGVEYLGGPGGGAAPAAAALDDDLTKRAPRELTARARSVETSLTGWYAGMRAPLNQVAQSSITTRGAARAADAVAGRVASGSARAVNAMQGAASKMGNVGRGLSGLAANLGPLEIAIGAAFAFEGLKAQLDKVRERSIEADNQLTAATNSTRQVAAQQKLAKSRAGGGEPGKIARFAGAVFHDPGLAKDVQGNLDSLTGTGAVRDAARADLENQRQIKALQERRKVANRAIAASRDQANSQTHVSAASLTIPLQTYDELSERVKDDASQRRAGLISQQEFDRRMATHAIEAKQILDGTRGQTRSISTTIARAQAALGATDPKSDAQKLRGFTDKALDEELKSRQTSFTQDSGAKNTGLLKNIAEEYKKRYGNRAARGDAAAIEALSTARDAYYSSLTTEAQGELALENSKTANPLTQAQNNVKAAKATVDRSKSIYGSHSQQYRQALSELNVARQQQAQAVLANVEADNALLIAQAGSDPVAQARAATQAAQNTLIALRSHSKSVDPNAIKNARAQLITARNSQQQAEKDQAQQLIQLQGQLSQAQANGDPIVGARAAQQAARAELAGAGTQAERLQALVDLANANNDLENAIKAQEDARYGYLESLTDDPVKKAALEVKKTGAAVKGTSGAARYQALAAYNEAKKGLRDAHLQSREDDIDFELTMGQISTQDAIERYNALLKIRNLTKSQKRDIKEKVKQLQDQSDQDATGFDLDVGSLKLPTIYDVRKAFDPIRKSVAAQQHEAARQLNSGDIGIGALIAQNKTSAIPDVSSSVSNLNDMRSNVKATVTVIVNDKNAVGEVMTAIDRAMGTNVKARMRSRGHRR